ncbi:hypothetical protein D3C86_1024590 [compost metagenome]
MLGSKDAASAKLFLFTTKPANVPAGYTYCGTATPKEVVDNAFTVLYNLEKSVLVADTAFHGSSTLQPAHTAPLTPVFAPLTTAPCCVWLSTSEVLHGTLRAQEVSMYVSYTLIVPNTFAAIRLFTSITTSSKATLLMIPTICLGLVPPVRISVLTPASNGCPVPS